MIQLFSIVGMRHQKDGESVMKRLKIGAELRLERDRKNHYDFCAIKVMSRGVTLGFIKATQNQLLARWMDERGVKHVDGTLAADGSGWPMFEIDIDL